MINVLSHERSQHGMLDDFACLIPFVRWSRPITVYISIITPIHPPSPQISNEVIKLALKLINELNTLLAA